ncbi:MAG: 4Fe-4S dicluster domain-containing protein [Victivallales bacterium]
MAINPFVKMTSTVIKHLLGPTACKMYPVEKPVFFANTRGHIGIETNKCILCTLCAKKCPTYAIQVDKPGKAWKIERTKCIMCLACVASCPKKCLTSENQYSAPVTVKVVETFNIEPPPPPKATETCPGKE